MKTKKLNLLKVVAFGVLPVASGAALVSCNFKRKLYKCKIK